MAVQGLSCWLGQREVKHSSKSSGNLFFLGGFMELQVDAAILSDTSGARVLAQRDVSTS